jgi:hypothetical protein
VTEAGVGSDPGRNSKCPSEGVTQAGVLGKQGLWHEETVTEAGVGNDPGQKSEVSQ